MSSPPRVFAAQNGKYKYAALADIQKASLVPNIELRISLASGHPLDPYYLPLLANKAVVFSGDDVKPMYEGADVVISYTASQAGLVSQLKAIRLAAGAGVKLFVPCEYSLEFDDIETSPHEKGKTLTVEDMANEEYPLVKLRRQAVDLCKELGMPCLRVITGIIPENFLVEEARHPYIDEASSYGWDLKDNKVTIIGSGDIPITFTPKEYYRAWFTHFITTTPLSELQSMGAVYLAAETLTQNQIIEMWEKKHGEKLQVTYVTGKDLEEMQQAVKKDRVHNYWSQWPGFIQLECAEGKGKLSRETTKTSYSGKVSMVEEML